MTISNPLADNSPDHEDQSLVLRARSGIRSIRRQTSGQCCGSWSNAPT